MSRLLLLLIFASLCLGGGVDCCLPDLAASEVEQGAGGCHDTPHQDEGDPLSPDDGAGHAEGPGCGSCTHCVTPASMPVSPRIALMLAPFDDGELPLAPDGLPPFAPPLRPPISRVDPLPIA